MSKKDKGLSLSGMGGGLAIGVALGVDMGVKSDKDKK